MRMVYLDFPHFPPLARKHSAVSAVEIQMNPTKFNFIPFPLFSTIYKTRNHVELHLKHYKLDDEIHCPDPDCQKAVVVLHGQLHFMNHAAREYDYDIFRKLGQ